MDDNIADVLHDWETSTEFEAELLDLFVEGLVPGEDEIISSDEIRLNAPPQFEFLETEKARYKVCWSGRAAGKSWQFARALIKRAASQQTRILCAREFQSSIGDSVHKLLDDQIHFMGLADMFDIKQTTIRHRTNGSSFIFKGLRRSIQEVRSMEGIDIAWIEEGQAVSEESWRILLATVRREDSEIWCSFNAIEETDPTYVRFVTKPEELDGKYIVKRVNWRDNPFLSRTALRRIKKLQKTDPQLFQHEYEGECLQRLDVQVLADRWKIDDFEPQAGWGGPYHGLDFGFSMDPCALVELYIDPVANNLYVRRERGDIHIPNTMLKSKLFAAIPTSMDHVVYADNSRPETIQYLRAEEKLNVVAAKKWPGSIEDGISYLKSFNKIIIHPSCKEYARECRLYRYKTDKLTGDVLAKIEDKHNHYIDATRYALYKLIRKRPEPALSFGHVRM